MNEFVDMLWAEARKAVRSRMPLWIALGSLFMPLGIAFLVLVARNPDISRKLGLISAKANLMALASTDWSSYLALFGQLLAAGGFILFVLTISWTFGREFVDGTLKEMLAVPVPRFSIVLAKFAVVAGWSLAVSVVIVSFALLMGAMIGLPGFSPSLAIHGLLALLVTACLTIVAVLPFAVLASVGRGYLLPMGLAVLMLMLTNFVMIAGWGEYFPWAVPGLYADGKMPLMPVSFWIVVLTGLAGVAATCLWWNYADQDR